MQVDVAVRAVLGAQAAADAPVLDDHFERIAAADGAHRTAHHAQRIAAMPAGRGDQIFVEALAFADQPGDAVVRIGAGAYAGIAARAALQIQHQQALRFHQSLSEKLIERHAGGGGQPLAVLCPGARARAASRLAPHVGELFHHLVKFFGVDADQFDMIERGAGRGAAAARRAGRFRRNSRRARDRPAPDRRRDAAPRLSRTPGGPNKNCRRRRPGGRSRRPWYSAPARHCCAAGR